MGVERLAHRVWRLSGCLWRAAARGWWAKGATLGERKAGLAGGEAAWVVPMTARRAGAFMRVPSWPGQGKGLISTATRKTPRAAGMI